MIDEALCIGCKECLEACPFGAMQYDDEGEVAMKCDLCLDRINADEAPACGSVCPTGCITWATFSAAVLRRATSTISGSCSNPSASFLISLE